MTNKDQFEQARKLYPGTCRGFDDEWLNFVKESKSRKWRLCNRTLDNVSPKLMPAIERQIAHRDSCAGKNIWCPQWKNFATWINGGCWTEEIPQTQKPNPARCRICNNTDVSMRIDGKGCVCWRVECKTEYARL